ncbi:autotransporter domain-containing protein [Caulobacter sp. RL271]|uniref:Autotransporter domain-containing protein n=1 Tax=Caulobacter segnis TaxID=88688 RepID=A0ABY4ZR84_9CAUL|nr:autotransporter domain-containing protein [Caulobacter segnis]USQ95221.1 autotransporter domain-containing protein [Caulobacter segnis]
MSQRPPVDPSSRQQSLGLAPPSGGAGITLPVGGRTAKSQTRHRLMSSLRLPLLAAPALIGVSLANPVEAQTTISTNRTSTYSLGGGITALTINPGVSVTTLSNAAISGGAGASTGVVITNKGTLNSTDTGPSGYGVSLTNAGTVINQGSINGQGNAGIRLVGGGRTDNQASAEITSDNYGIWIGGGTASVVNAGSIGTGGHGIYLTGGATTVNNSGSVISGAVGLYQTAGSATIVNSGKLQGNTYGVRLGTSGVITNTGTIAGIGASSSGVRLLSGGTIINAGTITSGSGGSAVALVAGGTLKLQTGSIMVGNVTGGSTGVLVLEGTGSFSNTTTGFASLTMTGSDWTIGGAVTATNTQVQAGTLKVNGTLTSSGGVQVDSGATLAGTGTSSGVVVQSGGILAPGSATSVGVLTLTGNYTAQAGSKLVINATATAASRLTIGGTASLDGELNIQAATDDYSGSPTFVVLSSTGTLSGTFSSVTSTANVTPTVTYDTIAKQVRVQLVTVSSGGGGGGGGGGVPETPAIIDGSQPFFGNGDRAVTSQTVTFDGGLLKPGQSLSIAQSVNMLSTGGTIDANGQTIALKGAISGAGQLAIQGQGSVIASGTISNTGGLAVRDNGALVIANGGIVAAPVLAASGGSLTVQAGAGVGGAVTVDGGALTVNENGAINGAVTIKDGGKAQVDGAIMASVDVSKSELKIGQTGSVGALTIGESGSATVDGKAMVAVDVTKGQLTIGATGSAGSVNVTQGGVARIDGAVAGAVQLGQGSVTIGAGGSAGGLAIGQGGVATLDGKTGAVSVNQGQLTLGSSGDATALVVSQNGQAQIDGKITNGVQVDQGVVKIGASGAVGGLTVGQGGVATLDGSVTGDVGVTQGTIDVGGSVAGTTTVTDGRLNLAASGNLGSLVLAQGGTLTGTGTVRGPATLSGLISPGNSPGVLTFKAPVTMTATAVLRMEIDGPTAGVGAGHHDALVVQGGSFTAAGTLTPVLRGISGDATNTYTPDLGQTFVIITADGGVQGRFSTLTQPNAGLSAGTRLEALYDANRIRLVVTPTSYVAYAGTRNQLEVAAALDAQRPSVGTASPLFDQIYAQTRSSLARTQDELSGKLHADLLAAELTSRRIVGQALADRLAGRRTGDQDVATAVWGKPIGAYAETDSDGNAAGAVQRIGGLMFGADRAFAGNAFAGASVGYLRNKTESKSGLGQGVAESYQASLYGGLGLGRAVVEASVGYAYTEFDTSREVVVGALRQVAQGDAHGHDLTAEVAASRRFVMGPSAWIEPRAGVSVDRLSRKGFTETGAAILGLRVDAADMTAARSAIGVRFGARTEKGAWVVQPTASLGWAHDFADITAVSDNVLNGVAFSAASSRPGRDALLVGLGSDFRLGDRMKAGFQIQDAYRRRENTVAASIDLSWTF